MLAIQKYFLLCLALLAPSMETLAQGGRGDDLVLYFAPSVTRIPPAGTWAMLSNHVAPTLREVLLSSGSDCTGAFAWSCWFNSNAIPTQVSNQRWVPLGTIAAESIAAADVDGDGNDELVASYNTPETTGTYLIKDVDTGEPRWIELHAQRSYFYPGDVDGNGRDDLVLAFYGRSQLWIRMDDGRWVRAHPGDPHWIGLADLDGNGQDDVLASFDGKRGLWARINNRKKWVRLHQRSPKGLYIADIDGDRKDDVIMNLGKKGVYVRRRNGEWVKLDKRSPIHIEPADLNGNGRDDLIFYFGSSGGGTYARMDNGKWRLLLSGYTQVLMAADVDGNGRDDVVFSRLDGSSTQATSTWVWMNNRQWAELASAQALGVLSGTPIPCPGFIPSPLQAGFTHCGFIPAPGFSRSSYIAADLDGSQGGHRR